MIYVASAAIRTALSALLIAASVAWPATAQMVLPGVGPGQPDQMAALISASPLAKWTDTGKTINQVFYANDTTNSFSRPALGADYSLSVANAINGAGPNGIFLAWGGATLNTDDPGLVIYGGDHNDYLGNEVYLFHFKTLSAERQSTPDSANASANCAGGAYPSGNPFDIHTYEAIVYAPATRSMVQIGGSGFAVGCSLLAAPPITFAYSFNTFSWSTLNTGNAWLTTSDAIAALDPSNGAIYLVDNDASGFRHLYKSSNSGSTWARVNASDTVPAITIQVAGALQPGNQFVLMGQGHVYSYNLSTGNAVTVTPTGDPDCISNAQGYAGPNSEGSNGLVWDTVGSVFLAMEPGAPTICSLDPSTYVWTAHAMTGATPPAEAVGSNGVFGRFQYLSNYAPGLSALLYIGGPTQDFFVARLPAGL